MELIWPTSVQLDSCSIYLTSLYKNYLMNLFDSILFSFAYCFLYFGVSRRNLWMIKWIAQVSKLFEVSRYNYLIMFKFSFNCFSEWMHIFFLTLMVNHLPRDLIIWIVHTCKCKLHLYLCWFPMLSNMNHYIYKMLKGNQHQADGNKDFPFFCKHKIDIHINEGESGHVN